MSENFLPLDVPRCAAVPAVPVGNLGRRIDCLLGIVRLVLDRPDPLKTYAMSMVSIALSVISLSSKFISGGHARHILFSDRKRALHGRSRAQAPV